jgi:hypothetical protein
MVMRLVFRRIPAAEWRWSALVIPLVVTFRLFRAEPLWWGAVAGVLAVSLVLVRAWADWRIRRRWQRQLTGLALTVVGFLMIFWTLGLLQRDVRMALTVGIVFTVSTLLVALAMGEDMLRPNRR